MLGAGVEDWRHLDLASVTTELWMNGQQATTGSGAEVLGHPLEALAWLANLRVRHGGRLTAGELVTTGSTCAALGWAEAGDVAEGRFAGLGAVRVEFT